MAFNYAALHDELIDDPLGRGYETTPMSDVEAADDLNTEYRDVSAQLNVDDVRQYLIAESDGAAANERSSLDMIREYADAATVRGSDAGETAKAARQSGAQALWFMLERDTPTFFPVDDPEVRDMFIAIGPDGGNGPTVLTNAQLLDLDALAIRTISRAEELGLGFVKPPDVNEARAMVR